MNFPDFQLEPVSNPGFLHELIVFFIEIDDIKLLAGFSVEKTALLVQVYNLEWLKDTGKFTCCNITKLVQKYALTFSI
jgi:hypothetical protein